MQLKITGKNIDIGGALRTHIEARIEQILSKFFDRGATAHVLLHKEGISFAAECIVHLDSRVDLQSKGTHDDPYASFEQAAEHLEKQLRRYKRRLKHHRTEGMDNTAILEQNDAKEKK